MNPYEEKEEIDLLNDESDDNQEFIDDETESEEEEHDMIQQDEIFDTPIIKKVHTAPKKKRVLSEEHKAKLQAGRLRALENRRANARKNKEIKELSKKKKDLEYNSLKKEVDDLEYPNPVSNHKVNSTFQDTYNLTEQQLLDLQEQAVEKYDTKRKARKKEKKEKQHNDNIKNLIQQTTRNVDNAWEMYVQQ